MYPIRDSLWHCSIVFSTRKYDRPCVIDLLGGVRVGIFIAAAHLKKAGSVIMSSILVYVFSVYCLECVVVPCDMATLVYISYSLTFSAVACCCCHLTKLISISGIVHRKTTRSDRVLKVSGAYTQRPTPFVLLYSLSSSNNLLRLVPTNACN